MAEVLRTKQSGELTQTFLEFLLMQTQQALFALGKHPSRPPNSPPPNLQLGKMYVDHLVMLRWKMDGNLSAEEQTVIMEVNRELHKNNPDMPPLPPTGFSPE